MMFTVSMATPWCWPPRGEMHLTHTHTCQFIEVEPRGDTCLEVSVASISCFLCEHAGVDLMTPPPTPLPPPPPAASPHTELCRVSLEEIAACF